MQPRQNSIVWMAWCMKISEGTNCKVRGHVTIAGAGSPPPTKYCSAHLSFFIIPWTPSLLLIRAPAVLQSGSIRGSQKLVRVLILRRDSINSSSPWNSPCHSPSSTACREANAAFLLCNHSCFYLPACWPSLSVSSLAVLAQQVQGCSQQQDRNGGQSQDHQHVLYHFLWARRTRQPCTVHGTSHLVWSY